MQFKIELGKLQAANLFASKEETRYYLNGVFFEINGGKLHLISTDGHRLIKIPVEIEGKKKPEDMKFIIPSSLIAKIKKARGADTVELTIQKDEITISYDGGTFTDKAIDGTFPDYTRVIPDQDATVKTEQARRKKLAQKVAAAEFAQSAGVFEIGFNPKYLADFAKVNELLGFKGSGVRLSATDEKSPVLVTMGGGMRDQYLAVLMPMRV